MSFLGYNLVKSNNIKSKGVDVAATKSEAFTFFQGLIDGYSSTFSVKSKAQALSAYRTIPQLNTLINLTASSMIRANKLLYKINKKGNKELVTDGDMYNLLQKPHFLQSSDEFWKTVIINWKLYGTQYTYKKTSAGYGISSMLALPTVDTEVKLKDSVNYLKAKDINDVIEYYEVVNGNGTTTKIMDSNDIWNLQDESLEIKNDGYVIPENPLSSIESTLATLVIISDIKNELLGNHGAMGIINPDGTDADGTVELSPTEKKTLQDSYEDYGITKGKYKLMITNKAVKFTEISLPIAELLLNEFEARAERTLAANTHIPVTYFTADSKYQNKEIGDRELYENNIIPSSKILTDSFNSSFNLAEQGMSLEFDYSHISFLQSDKKDTATTNKLNSSNIISLNTAVADKKMTREAAISTLVAQGVNEEDAKNIISEPIINTNQNGE